MIKYMYKYAPHITALGFLLMVPMAFVWAQGLVPCSGTNCQACHLVQLAERIVDFFILIMGVIGAIIFMIGGFFWVTAGGDPGAVTRGKNTMFNALIGLMIVLLAWLIVDTILQSLTGGTINGQPWNDIQCVAQPTLSSQIIAEDTALIGAGLATTSATVPAVNNCGFDESSLVSIPGEGGHRAVASVASSYVNMRTTAAGRGITLSITSSYRSDARQTQLWDQCPICQTQGTVARPCSRGGSGSRHSSGLALDISSSQGRAGRCEIRNLCRSQGATFIMFYGRSNHVHCDWGGSGEVGVSCP